MKKIRTVAGTFATALGISVASVGVAVPANAAIGDCASGYLCAWVDTNYNGARLQLSSSNNNWGIWGQSTCLKRLTWSDCASSLYNRTSATCFRLYDAADRTGGYHRISPGDTIANLGTWSYNDVITSNSAIAGSTC